jgi:hypothetical protein
MIRIVYWRVPEPSSLKPEYSLRQNGPILHESLGLRVSMTRQGQNGNKDHGTNRALTAQQLIAHLAYGPILHRMVSVWTCRALAKSCPAVPPRLFNRVPRNTIELNLEKRGMRTLKVHHKVKSGSKIYCGPGSALILNAPRFFMTLRSFCDARGIAATSAPRKARKL